uniref:Uncharacterized protein n=1 Tax=Acrobeloides nanus TaxID=290746 RepID=A0A914DQC5_9BILA
MANRKSLRHSPLRLRWPLLRTSRKSILKSESVDDRLRLTPVEPDEISPRTPPPPPSKSVSFHEFAVHPINTAIRSISPKKSIQDKGSEASSQGRMRKSISDFFLEGNSNF